MSKFTCYLSISYWTGNDNIPRVNVRGTKFKNQQGQPATRSETKDYWRLDRNDQDLKHAITKAGLEWFIHTSGTLGMKGNYRVQFYGFPKELWSILDQFSQGCDPQAAEDLKELWTKWAVVHEASNWRFGVATDEAIEGPDLPGFVNKRGVRITTLSTYQAVEYLRTGSVPEDPSLRPKQPRPPMQQNRPYGQSQQNNGYHRVDPIERSSEPLW